MISGIFGYKMPIIQFHFIPPYIDDIYLQDDIKEKYIKNIVDTVTLLSFLGFTVRAEKSQFFTNPRA